VTVDDRTLTVVELDGRRAAWIQLGPPGDAADGAEDRGNDPAAPGDRRPGTAAATPAGEVSRR
jgi:hypothetical protein